MAEEICIVNKKNLSVSKCNKLPAYFVDMITTPEDFEMAEASFVDNATLKAALQVALDAVESTRVYLWPPFVGVENASEAAVYETTPQAVRLVRNGKYGWRINISESLCNHKNMFSHAATGGRVIFIDGEGQWFCMKKANGKIAGFSISILNPENLIISDGAVSTKSPIYLVLKNHRQVNTAGILISGEVGAAYEDVKRLTDVDLTIIGTPSLTTINVSVLQHCDGEPVLGLVVGDFILKTTAGVTQTITSRTDNGDGTYTLTDTDFATGTLTLKPSNTISVAGYESTGPVVVTVV